MEDITIREVERFPEPEFNFLQREVFANVQAEEAMVDQMLSEERRLRESMPPYEKPNYAAMVRVGAYLNEQLVAWSCGWFERGEIFYMANSGVLSNYRRQGVYAQLIAAILSLAKERGAVQVRSHHSVLNNAVLIAKLKCGFQVSGLSASAQSGLLVELTHHLSPLRGALYSSRVIPFVAQQKDV